MGTEIRIRAEPQVDPAQCKFHVDRPVYPDGAAYFPSAVKSKGSPLAERIFGVPGVAAVLVARDRVVVTKAGDDDWLPVAKRIGAAIREHLASGRPAVAAEFKAGLPTGIELMRRVQEVFETQVNPAVASHGGYVELADVRGNDVYIRMHGGCHGCASSEATLQMGIEQILREHVPEVGEILDTTDHATGENPYYAPAG